MLKGIVSRGRFTSGGGHQKTPAWKGGLSPFGDKYQEENMIWVFCAGQHMWLPYSRVAEPTDYEFRAFFKKPLVEKKLRIKNKYNHQIDSELVTVIPFEDKPTKPAKTRKAKKA
jgi:hypothetical protein